MFLLAEWTISLTSLLIPAGREKKGERNVSWYLRVQTINIRERDCKTYFEVLCCATSNTYIFVRFREVGSLSEGKKFCYPVRAFGVQKCCTIEPWLPYLSDLIKFLRLLVLCYSRWSKFNILLLRRIFEIHFFLVFSCWIHNNSIFVCGVNQAWGEINIIIL